MKIGIISDTHAGEITDLALPIRQALTRVDLIVHAGDFIRMPILEGLRAMGRVEAVCGNMDCGEIKTSLPESKAFEIKGKRIGLTHGSGAPWGIAERVRSKFDAVDIIIFGHSHQTYNRYVQGTLMINPGSAKSSYAILTINDEVRAEIFKF